MHNNARLVVFVAIKYISYRGKFAFGRLAFLVKPVLVGLFMIILFLCVNCLSVSSTGSELVCNVKF